MNHIDTMKLALEALEYIRNIDTEVSSQIKYGNAAQVIEEALASEAIEQPAPVQQGWETVPVEPTVAMIDATGAVEADMREMVVANWKEMLAAAPQPARQEPCGWQFFQDGKWHNGMEINDHRANTEAAGIPVCDVYTSPPASKPWVGLTPEDHQAAWDAMSDYEDYDTYGAVLEAKLREKNA